MAFHQKIFSALGIVCATASTSASADCLKVAEDQEIKINPVEANELAAIGIDRSRIFEAMVATAVPETEGCWAGGTGNFDGQLVSVGFAQWNYGQGSLQTLLAHYRQKFATEDAFNSERDRYMPSFGRLLFSEGCLRFTKRKPDPTARCIAELKAQQSASGRLNPVFAGELNALFESLPMRQIQTDTFVRLLGSVRSDLIRLFPGQVMSGRKIKWAIDTKVQQGGFPGDGDVERVRARLKSVQASDRPAALKPLVGWYDGLAASLDQQGTKYDRQWNVQQWLCVIDAGADEEQTELLYLTFLRSRTAATKSGYYQALAFQRRAKIVFGVGSVGGRRDGRCPA